MNCANVPRHGAAAEPHGNLFATHALGTKQMLPSCALEQLSRSNCPRFCAGWATQEEAELCLLGSLCGTPLIGSIPSLSVSTRRGCPSRSLSTRRGEVEAVCKCTGKPGASFNGVPFLLEWDLTSVKISNFQRCLRRRRRCVLFVEYVSHAFEPCGVAVCCPRWWSFESELVVVKS